VVVRIVDDGPGIPEDALPRIFEPFFTTKPKGMGTGLGLGIVKRIVDKHAGEVTCDSRPGRTAFSVWLPVRIGRSPDGSRTRVTPEVSST
jgi:signal transduction histidine kinase